MIHFFSEETSYSLPQSAKTIQWIQRIAAEESQQVDTLNYVFCNDTFLLNLNKEYLAHDTYTDILTFDQRDQPNDAILADVFISIERVEDNARSRGLLFEDELDRVMAHGLLHLMGYSDKTEEDRVLMRKKEDACLSLR